jgi:hypothetical protein
MASAMPSTKTAGHHCESKLQHTRFVLQSCQKMKRPTPRTTAAWLKEIKLAIADAAEAAPFGRAIDETMWRMRSTSDFE